MAEALQHKVYFHHKRFGKFTRGKKRRTDDALTEFAKENGCNSIAEIRIFVHRGYPVKNVKAKRSKDGVEVSTGKSTFTVPVEQNEAEITGPAVGTDLQMRLINTDPCFWLIGKRKKVENKDTKKAKKETKSKADSSAQPAKETVKEPEKTEKNGKGKKTKQQQLKKKKQATKQRQNQKDKRKRKASKNGKAAKKRKLNNVAKKNEASRDLIAKLASLHEDSKKQSLKKSHERVDKFEEKLQKKEHLSKRKKMRMMKMKGDFSELHKKPKKKPKKKGGKRVQFAA